MPLISHLHQLVYALEAATDLERIGDERELHAFDIYKVNTVEWMHIEYQPDAVGGQDVLAYGESNTFGWWLVEAWCDESGWLCRSGGHIRVSTDKDALIRFGMSKETRRLAGLALDED